MKNIFFTLSELAENLKVSEQTIMQQIRRGNLRGYKIGKGWRFSDDQIDDYMEKRLVSRVPKRKLVIL
jgi:excisionase family DNA binding protein